MFIRACFFIERETPALRALMRAGAFHPDRQLANTEHPVAHASQRLAEANSLRTIIAEPQRKRRLARQRQLVEVIGTDLRRAEPIPPGRHEAAPDSRPRRRMPPSSRRGCRGTLRCRRPRARRPASAPRTRSCRCCASRADVRRRSMPGRALRQAATMRARLARTQVMRSGWRKPARCQGRSTCASSRMRTRRRAISLENSGLLPVAIHDAADRQSRHL